MVGNGVANVLGQCGEGLIGESGDTLEGEFGAKGDCGDEMGDLLSLRRLLIGEAKCVAVSLIIGYQSRKERCWSDGRL